jgi:beta-phosphoglucomutase-like phosphatase (HAD superfamily)
MSICQDNSGEGGDRCQGLSILSVTERRPGYVYLDNSPTCERDYESAKFARDYYVKARNAPPAEQERLLQQGVGALRTSYEALVIYGLFNEVVKRFEERVSFDRLKDVCTDRDIVDEVIERMAALSRFIEAHLHSDNYAAEKPSPDVLLQEIDAFEALQKKQKERKRDSAVTRPVAPSTIIKFPGKEKEPPSLPEQPGSTAIN